MTVSVPGAAEPQSQYPFHSSATALQQSNPNHNSVLRNQQALYISINIHPPYPSIQEIKEAIKKLRNHKGTRHRFYPGQNLQRCSYSCGDTTEALLLKEWGPQERHDWIITYVFKKGNHNECKIIDGSH